MVPMNKLYTRSLFIFRRDLRIEDNNGLRNALESSESVIPCLIFTPEQIGIENTYRSIHAIHFMVESLIDLAYSLEQKGAELYLFQGSPHKVVEHLIRTEKIEAVFVNRDYTPYSRARDELIQGACSSHSVAFKATPDSLLIEPEEGLTAQSTPYQIFTPFFKKNSSQAIPEPSYHHYTNYATTITAESLPLSFIDTLVTHNISLRTRGGRTVGKKILATLKTFSSYATSHDQVAQETTGLSAHNKFGTVSIREVYHAISQAVGKDNGLLRQLYWRDFFTHVAWFHPRVFGHAFQEKFEHISWNTSKKDFDRWCTGTTGFPIVDAGMRQLNETGYMHNRARLIVGSFLTKDLQISWLWGEKYFAQQLEDYDPCVNNGNWQWVASTGCDAQPYFRIFNPWLQQKKFDPECIYIKRWIPELAHVDPHVIHLWYKQKVPLTGYPLPMVDHATESRIAKALYKQAASVLYP